ncbi:hypothetical protein [Microbulbifer sp. ZKSA002]|uniref:hypothetical protein n=1 Tax=Microbulbifer sp. ZKSA002 TaxID=3243388 RepID=UPI0040394A3F
MLISSLHLSTEQARSATSQTTWLAIISLLLGAACIQLVIMRFFNGQMAPDVFASLLHQLVQTKGTPALVKSLASHLIPYSAFVTYTLHLVLLLAGTLLILRVFIVLGATLMFFGFILLWGLTYMGENSWYFEFLSPALFALILAVSIYKLHKDSQYNFRSRFLGAVIAPRVSLLTWGCAIVVASALLFGVFVMSRNGGDYVFTVSALSSITIAILSIASKYLDKYRNTPPKQDSTPILGRWIDLFTFTIGVMLVFQIFEDGLLNWFTVEGYRGLINSYVEYGNTPYWYRGALAWVADHAEIFMPTQRVFETVAAICMVILVFRFPVVLLATGLFAILSFTEFGVTNAWPPAPGKPPAWVFELLLTTLVSFTCGLYYLLDAIAHKSWKHWILGPKIFDSISDFNKCFLFIFLLIIEVIIFSSTPIQEETKFIALHFSALSLIPLFFTMIILDKYRAITPKIDFYTNPNGKNHNQLP